MDNQQQLQLEDAQKRLSIFRKHLDLLARCSGESKNVDANEILSAVSELQSLVEWASQQPELGAESAVLLVKLQELHQIRVDLEKAPKEGEEDFTAESKDTEDHIIPDKPESYSKDLEYISDIVTTDLCDNNGDNVLEEDSFNLSGDKESLCDFSASTEDPNMANADSPTSIEDTNVDIIPNDDKPEEISDENDYPRPRNDPRGSLNSEENQQENLEIQESFEDHKIEIPESVPETTGIKSPNLFRSEVVIIETDEDNKVTECLSDSKNSNDPLDICMYAIRNLYESLRVKENELLKLSAMQNDQKHIEALQAVIIDFHKDITNLNSQLESTKKENIVLKEQVLELEEAENDARLEAQKLGQKLVFLQEKDSHSQAELSQLKQTLKKSTEMITEKEASEKELRSQLKYMETLVQKYEDQIKVMEAKEIANFQKLLENKLERANEDSAKQEKTVSYNKGTQTYPISQTKIDCNGEVLLDSDNYDRRSSCSQSVQVPEESKDENINVESENMGSSIPSTSNDETTQPKEEPGLVNMECTSQKKLLTRLHKLIDEDVSLQQQIHYVDQINLALWKKLQNLDTHIGECKRQNINETDPVIPETVLERPSNAAPKTETHEPSGITTNQNIPAESVNCLDQNEQYIQERLTKLEEINASFEKELKTRENICKEKEKKYEEWMETEKRLTNDLKRLSDERNCLVDQISNLKKEKDEFEKQVRVHEEELNTLKKNNQEEITKLRAEQESMTDPLNLTVNQLLAKEKEILKMITNIKSEKTKNQDKSELERLKCGYIQLQFELSHFREEINKLEERYRIRLDESAGKHLVEETQRIKEIERLRNENTRCDKMLSNLEMKQQDLLNVLEKQEKYLQHARENYKKNLEETEEEHRYVETELKTQLNEIEEGTEIATTALMEERKRVEHELHENIDDLRTKEEVYKTRIAELERNVAHLHEELHKMAEESETKQSGLQLEANAGEEVSGKMNEASVEKTVTDDQYVPPEIIMQTPDSKSNLKFPQDNTVEEEPAPAMKDHLDQITKVENIVEEEFTEENVDELRAQVRELQCQLEAISVETSEMPPVQPAKPVQPVKQGLGSQKLEDLDYAEVDDILDTWRKPEQTASSKDISSNFQGAYGDKYRAGGGEKSRNERVYVQEAVEENDYDEVLPRPTNFHVVQQVGSDTLLVGWNYVNPSILDGFEVYLGDQVHERIYIPDRTKALISGLNLRKPIHLSICALSRYGQMSEPAVLDLSLPHEINSKYFEDEDDEYRDFEDPMKRKQRPYSMEW